MNYEDFEKAVNACGQKIGFTHMGVFNAAHALLAESENVKGASGCIDVKGTGALIVTEHNFYAYKKTGLLTTDTTIIPLEKITSYSKSSGFGCDLEVSDGTVIYTYFTAQNIDSILSAIKAGKSTPANTAAPAIPQNDKFAEVKKYKELLDQGIIDQAEFDKKKAELLNL